MNIIQFPTHLKKPSVSALTDSLECKVFPFKKVPESSRFTNEIGDIFWLKNERVFQVDTLCNLNNPVFHRLDGPAVIEADGTKLWYVDGKLHRLDGPAYILNENNDYDYVEWWVDGKLHRLDGPAVIWPDGHQEWWVDGKLHRLDGPAVIYADGDYWWYVDGNHYYDNTSFQSAAGITDAQMANLITIYGNIVEIPD